MRENGWLHCWCYHDRSFLCRNDRCCSKGLGHKHKCAHCNTVADAIGLVEAELQEQDIMSVSAVAELLSFFIIAAELQGLHLMANGSQRASCQPSISSSKLPISSIKVPLELHSPVMAACASSKLGESVGCLQAAGVCLATHQTIRACRWIGATLSALPEKEIADCFYCVPAMPVCDVG